MAKRSHITAKCDAPQVNAVEEVANTPLTISMIMREALKLFVNSNAFITPQVEERQKWRVRSALKTITCAADRESG